jgi:SAM-dependent methyltransferase
LTAFQDPTGGTEPARPSPFAAIEAVYDPETVRLLYMRGLDDGWRCLEVGGGSGSIAKWLSSRVGTYGRVVVTDLDISHMEGLEAPTLEIDKHDIVNDPMPENVFHLVHARLVLSELPERDKVLERMAASLRSDGWVVIEELDRGSLAPDCDDANSAAIFERIQAAIAALLRGRGLDPDYGRRVYRRLLSLGLTSASARGGSSVQPGGSPSADVLREEIAQFREELLALGLAGGEDLDAYEALLRDPAFAFMTATMVTTWARRPSPI